MDINNIKLIIWDLDDTFWKGTLSEGEIFPIQENIQLVKDLTDRGIVNAICSKNDKVPVEQKLKELGVDEFFVFNSIDWTPKGERVSRMISEMGFRPANVLFLDDNLVNLNEALFYSPELMISEPDVLPALISQVATVLVKDKAHSRLKNYKILEQKRDSKASYGDNEAFLYSTNTRVDIQHDCLKQIDRIHELILRTNQLNFTKNRMPMSELERLLRDPEVDSGYVHVRDKFGDYGIVGFYAIRNDECIHFLFSCRTIGQGVEQYVYSVLNHPKLTTVGKVINEVQKVAPPSWINQRMDSTKSGDEIHEQNGHTKIVFKGPCDMMVMTSYLIGAGNIIEEYTYEGEKGNRIEHHNHSLNILEFRDLTDDRRQQLLRECIFNDVNMFKTAMFDKDVSLVFLSTLQEPHMGVYKCKDSDLKIAFGDYTRPLTDRKYREFYLTTHQYDNPYTEEWLDFFSEKYEYLGRLTPRDVLENYKKLLSKMTPKANLCLALGSETAYEKEQIGAFLGREQYHKELNLLLRKWASTESRVYLLDWNDFIIGQESFNGSIGHFTRNVYYQASLKVREIIEDVTGEKVSGIPAWKRISYRIKDQLLKILNADTFFSRILMNFYRVLNN